MKNVKNVSRSFGYFEWVCDKLLKAFVVVPLVVAPIFRGTEIIVRPYDASFMIVMRYGRDEYLIVRTK